MLQKFFTVEEVKGKWSPLNYDGKQLTRRGRLVFLAQFGVIGCPTSWCINGFTCLTGFKSVQFHYHYSHYQQTRNHYHYTAVKSIPLPSLLPLPLHYHYSQSPPLISLPLLPFHHTTTHSASHFTYSW